MQRINNHDPVKGCVRERQACDIAGQGRKAPGPRLPQHRQRAVQQHYLASQVAQMDCHPSGAPACIEYTPPRGHSQHLPQPVQVGWPDDPVVEWGDQVEMIDHFSSLHTVASLQSRWGLSTRL